MQPVETSKTSGGKAQKMGDWWDDYELPPGYKQVAPPPPAPVPTPSFPQHHVLPAPVVPRITFGVWLTAQQHRHDNIGALAQAFATDKTWTPVTLFHHLLTMDDPEIRITSEDFRDLKAAEKEYRNALLVRKEWQRIKVAVGRALLCDSCASEEVTFFKLEMLHSSVSRVCLCAPCRNKIEAQQPAPPQEQPAAVTAIEAKKQPKKPKKRHKLTPSTS